MKEWMQNVFFALVIIIICGFLPSCGINQYTAHTIAQLNPDGSLSWDSTKNQENLKASFNRQPNGAESFTLETTASTPEAAIAAASQNIAKLTDTVNSLIQQLMPLLMNAAKVAATTGS